VPGGLGCLSGGARFGGCHSPGRRSLEDAGSDWTVGGDQRCSRYGGPRCARGCDRLGRGPLVLLLPADRGELVRSRRAHRGGGDVCLRGWDGRRSGGGGSLPYRLLVVAEGRERRRTLHTRGRGSGGGHWRICEPGRAAVGASSGICWGRLGRDPDRPRLHLLFAASWAGITAA